MKAASFKEGVSLAEFLRVLLSAGAAELLLTSCRTTVLYSRSSKRSVLCTTEQQRDNTPAVPAVTPSPWGRVPTVPLVCRTSKI